MRKRAISDWELIALYKPPIVGHVTQAFDIYIGCGDVRYGLGPSMWGSPFDKSFYGLEGSMEQYEAWIRGRPEMMGEIDKLKGKILGCHCRTKDHESPLCHGDILRKIFLERARQSFEESPDF